MMPHNIKMESLPGFDNYIKYHVLCPIKREFQMCFQSTFVIYLCIDRSEKTPLEIFKSFYQH